TALPVAAVHGLADHVRDRLVLPALVHDGALLDDGHAHADVADLGAHLGDPPGHVAHAGADLGNALGAVGGVRLLPAFGAVGGAGTLVGLGDALGHLD